MSEILIVLAFILSVVFLRIGLKMKSHKKLVYLLFSSLSLFAAVLMLFFLPWNFGIFQNVEQASTPKVDVEPKEDPTDIEEPPVIVAPSESEEPEKRDDANDLDEKPAVPSPPSNPPPTPEPEPEPAKIVIPDNETIQYVVKKKDTLWSIAIRSGKTVDKIKQWNSLISDVIYLGQTLVLYGKNVEPLPTPPPKTEEPPTSVASVLISQGDVQKKELAFTFDAGSDAVGIRILDVLKKHNVKATFFLTGKWVEKFPAYAKRIVVDGHDIGNHSYSHPDAVKIDASLLKQEIIYAEKAIEKATGQSPRPYFRFPYGSYNSAALQTVGSAAYPFSIQWSLDTIDWQQPKTEVIVNRIMDGASNGDIILMHIGGVHTPEAVDQVIPLLRAKGYKLVTLSELLT